MGSSNALCLTAPCIHAASEILYNLSPNYKTVDPCTNFEECTCHADYPVDGYTGAKNRAANLYFF